MNVEPMTVHGWKFEIDNSQLIISAEDGSQQQLRLGAQAAFSLLDYLYQYRTALHDAAQEEEDAQVAQQKEELNSENQGDEVMSE